MNSLPGEAEAGERLKQTALRDFGPVLVEDDERPGMTYKLSLNRHDAPVPSLLKYALNLVGLKAYGPDEKVAWWVDFTYRGEWCELAHQKFGLRLVPAHQEGYAKPSLKKCRPIAARNEDKKVFSGRL